MTRIEESVTESDKAILSMSEEREESSIEGSASEESSESQDTSGGRRTREEDSILDLPLRSITPKGKVMVIGRSGKNPVATSVTSKTVVEVSMKTVLWIRKKE